MRQRKQKARCCDKFRAGRKRGTSHHLLFAVCCLLFANSTMGNFRDLLESDSIHVFDGAMGTMLYAKGVYINRCYDELNISNPDLVREVHAEYCRAGADILETNTFGATAPKLAQYGLEANLHEINCRPRASPAAGGGDDCYVAGAVGPLGLRIEPYGPTSYDEAKDLFKATDRGAARRRRRSVSARNLLRRL